MDTRTIEGPLTQFFEAVSRQVRVDQLIVFGSYLEGTASADSDIDVIVVSEDFTSLSEDERLDILEAAAEEIEPCVHPWGFTPVEVEQASELTTLGHARAAGIRFVKPGGDEADRTYVRRPLAESGRAGGSVGENR